MKRGLVISGGGSKGAFAGGIIEYLIKEKGIKWDSGIGSSTGAIMLPLTILGDIDVLKKYYTNITDKDIFNVRPYNKKGKIRILNAIFRILLGKKSIGKANNLHKNIKKTLTEEKFIKLKESEKDAIITVTNYTKGITEYKSIKDFNYEDFTSYMLASASVPIIFDVVELNGEQYLDGGILESVPLQRMVNNECNEIDIIVLKVNKNTLGNNKLPKLNNMFDIVVSSIDLMNAEITYDDINIGSLIGDQKEIKLNFYYLPNKLTTGDMSSLTFDKDRMSKWWSDGYKYAEKLEFKEVILQKKLKGTGYKIK